MANPPISVELVCQLIRDQFQHWSSLPVQTVELGGWDNRTFRLGDTMSVRLPSAGNYAAQVDKEHRWLPELAPHLPLPIPTPIAKGVPGAGYPWSWSVYRWLDGSPASASTVADLTDFAVSVAEFLSALHRIDASGAPSPGEHNFQRGGQLKVYDAETRTALAGLSRRFNTGLAETVWAAALMSEWANGPLWVHGDIAPGNLLVRDGELCAVIDFGCMTAGDPACDLVIAWTMFKGDSREAFRRALPFNENTWRRARGWALWKAAIVAAGDGFNPSEVAQSLRILAEVTADHL